MRCHGPKEVGWGTLGADYVYKSTCIFLVKEDAQAIIDDCAKKAIYSALTKDNSQVVVMGVNSGKYDGSKNLVLCASYTTNGLVPVVKTTHDKCKINEFLVTTVHTMTVTQADVDWVRDRTH